MSKRVVFRNHRGNDYGILFETMWPHVSVGVSAHLSSRFGHVTFHTPVGYVIVGCLGADRRRTVGGDRRMSDLRRCKTHDCEWGECFVTHRHLRGECELEYPTNEEEK